MDLSIAIASYNTRDLLSECLESLRVHESEVRAELIVVDNGSADGTLKMLRSRFPGVQVIANESNRGFAAAINQAMRAASGRYVMLLNSDTLMLPGTLDQVVAFMDEKPGVAAVGCRLINTDGSLQPSVYSFPSLLKDVLNAASLGTLLRRWPAIRAAVTRAAAHLGQSPSSYDDYARTKEVDFATGACLTVRREVVDQVGPMDDSFFFTGEEADWCYRIRQAGWQVYYLAEATVVHSDHASTGGYTPRRYLQSRKGTLQFCTKHYGTSYVLALGLLVSPILALRIVCLTARLPLTKSARSHILAKREALWSHLRMYWDPRFAERNMLYDPIFRHLD